ncbi:MAG: hypothetical protein HY619_07795, partial [Thaumarchaeota archaeon]|nr:hypothetical protein [Nitrososphaerota archaeon]
TELMQRLFDKLWGESLDAKDAVHSVKLGVVVPETSAIYEREQIFKKELDLINSAKSRVILLMSSSMVPKLLSEPLASALNDCMRTNVKVRVMTNFNEQKLGELQAVSETHDLRFVDFKISIETLAIDNSATLVTSGANEGEGEVAFWTSQREYSELVCNFLEQAWSNAHNPSQYFLHASLTKNLNMGLKQIGEELEKKGWAVSTPGVIEGGSAVNHTFKMVASNQGEVVAIDYFLSNEPVGTQPLIAYGAKKSDARLNRIILLLSPEADEEAARLAKFFGIDVIEGTDASLLLSGARNMLGLG